MWHVGILVYTDIPPSETCRCARIFELREGRAAVQRAPQRRTCLLRLEWMAVLGPSGLLMTVFELRVRESRGIRWLASATFNPSPPLSRAGNDWCT